MHCPPNKKTSHNSCFQPFISKLQFHEQEQEDVSGNRWKTEEVAQKVQSPRASNATSSQVFFLFWSMVKNTSHTKFLQQIFLSASSIEYNLKNHPSKFLVEIFFVMASQEKSKFHTKNTKQAHFSLTLFVTARFSGYLLILLRHLLFDLIIFCFILSLKN